MEMPCRRTRFSLDGRWSLVLADPDRDDAQTVRTIADVRNLDLPVYEASVPGNLELDLQANGIIPEPFHGRNIADNVRFERCRAIYFRRFRPPEGLGPVVILEAQGLDCYATVMVNGVVLGSADNMLIERRFPIDPSLLAEESEIVVLFDPPLRPASEAAYPRLVQAMGSNYESLYTRKAPHMYGWDIMPRALSAGIWRSMDLLGLPEERIEQTYLETLELASAGGRASQRLHFAVELTGHPHDGYELEVEGRCGEAGFAHRTRILYGAGALRFDVADPLLWWPRGRGPQNLYDCRVRLYRHGELMDAVAFTHGIRTIRLERTELTDDAGGGAFLFQVNGTPLFVLGTNWAPLDAYHSRDRARVDRAMELAVEIGCNMIRCWGGNVYESDRFYDRCDRAGILVWQDFAMACGIYPQDEAFQEVIRREAVAVVRRLRSHACLALWAGDNECDASHLWGASGVDPNTNVLTRRVLPEVLRNEDPGRPYLPSSPYIGPEAMEHGTRWLVEDHLWGPRDYYKGEYYTSALCKFASEIGYHGCPEPATLREFLSEDKVWPYADNEEWRLHATSPVPGVDLYDYRVELMANQVRVLFGRIPEGLEEFAYASQASQAEAMKFFIEMFRSQKWRRTGIIWWNLLDGWPQFSDAVVDYYFRRKRAFRAIQRAQSPLLMAFREPEQGMQELVLCSDIPRAIQLEFSVRDMDTGEVLTVGEASVDADSVATVHRLPYRSDQRRLLLIEWSGGGLTGWSHYLSGQPPFDLRWYRAHMDELDRRA